MSSTNRKRKRYGETRPDFSKVGDCVCNYASVQEIGIVERDSENIACDIFTIYLIYI